MPVRKRAISRATCWFLVLTVIVATAASAGENRSPVLVRMLVRNTRSVSPEAGVLIADRPSELVVLDLRTGRERTFPKSQIRSLINPATEQDVAAVTGIAPLVAWFVAESLPSRPKSGQIASVDGAVAYINRGSNVGIKEGERFDVFRGDGKEIVDPETGEVLGTTQKRIAQVEVVELREKLSKVRIAGDLEVELAVRDVVRPVAAEQAVAVLPLGRDSGQLIQGGVQLAEEMISGLTKNGVYVVERALLDKLLEEQNLAGTGKFDADTVQRVGKLLNAQAIVTGTIQVNARDVDINVRLVDVETGKVLYATSLMLKDINTTPVRTQHQRLNRAEPHEGPQATNFDRVDSQAILENSIGMKLILIPAGEFSMGSPESPEQLLAQFPYAKPERISGERPLHRVRLTRPFFMGQAEVTVGEFQRFVEATAYRTEAETDRAGGLGWDEAIGRLVNGRRYKWSQPGFAQSDNHPVVNVTWNDAVEFCNWLTRTEGRNYRLPTEAEWEYACRAGSTARYNHGDEPEGLVAFGNVPDLTAAAKFGWWCALKSSDGWEFTAPVRSYRPNAFGLYDMHGNVWEWCADGYSAVYYSESPAADPQGPTGANGRVIRGGGWGDYAVYCRAACRLAVAPETRTNDVGFRVVCDP